MRTAETDPLVVLSGLADASALAVKQLKRSVPNDALHRAARMIGAAKTVTVAGRAQAGPVAAFLAEGLEQAGYRCRLLQLLDRAQMSQIVGLGADDVLAAISFGQSACPVANLLSATPDRRVRVLGIADRAGSPVAKLADVSFVLRSAVQHEVQPLAPHFVLVQSLLVAVGDGRVRGAPGSP